MLLAYILDFIGVWSGSGTEVTAPIETDKDVVKAIDFENTPLTVVVEKINETYNVKVTGLPESPSTAGASSRETTTTSSSIVGAFTDGAAKA